MINNTISFIDCMFMLHRSISYFQVEEEKQAFSEFKIFCENAPNHEQLQNVENNVYYRVWKLEDRPTHETHPKIAHYDFGRLAFHGQEGRSTSHRALAIQFAYIRVLKKQLEKIYIQYKQGDVKSADTSLNKLLPIKIWAASSVFKTLGLSTIEELFFRKVVTELAPKTFLEALLHDDLGEKKCSFVEEKMKATDACILALNCTKFTTNLLPRADDYFKRKSLEISPVDTSHQIISLDQAEDKMKDLFGKYQGICFAEGTHDDFFTECFYKSLHGSGFYDRFRCYFGFFQKMGVKVMFIEERVEVMLQNGEKSAQGLRIIPMDSKYARTYSHTDGNVRAELMNYAAAKIINQQRKTLKEGEKFIAWMGRGHLTDIQVIDTYPNSITQERKILGVATLTGCPSIEIRSKANSQNVEGWLAGKGDGALQKGFGSERKINGLLVSFQKFPTRANIEIHEK